MFEFKRQQRQFVCTGCGHNMIGQQPDFCSMCGDPKHVFITLNECSSLFDIIPTQISEKIARLETYPPLGNETCAYIIKAGHRSIWVDCPSPFHRSVPRADLILVTHCHALGCSNMYRKKFKAEVWIHRQDAEDEVSHGFPLDRLFEKDFSFLGIEAFHLGGHTNGFTAFLFDGTLFISDMVYFERGKLRFQPSPAREEVKKAAKKLVQVMQEREIGQVCSSENCVDYAFWKSKFEQLLAAHEPA